VKTARKYNASIALRSADIKELVETGKKISSDNFKDIVFDPITSTGAGLPDSVDRYTVLRKGAAKGIKEYGFPLMGIASAVYENRKDPTTCAYEESLLAGLLICRYASIIVMRTTEPWALLPVFTLRQSLYADPSTEPCVEAKAYTVGTPGRDSPLIVTSNFALTYYSVSEDLEAAGISAYVLAVDTGGLAVTVALAAEKLTAQSIKEALNSVKDLVNHKKVIIPGAAAQLKTDLEKSTGWTVLTGPQDSSGLSEFLKRVWKK